MPAIVSGDRVQHGTYGLGTVTRVVSRFRVRVHFDAHGALARTVTAADLRAVDKVAMNAAAITAPGHRAPLPVDEPRVRSKRAPVQRKEPATPPIDRTAAWQCLEALRLGVVPSRGTNHYTVGRKKPMQVLEGLLGKAAGFHGIFGEYGEGKTHLLDAFQGMARDGDFAVSRLAVDPQETAVQNPARIWSALAARLECRGAMGLRAFLERLTESDAHALPDGERFDPILSPCLFALRSGDPDCIELAMSHAMAEQVSLDEYRNRLKRAGWNGPAPIYLPDYRTLGGVYVRMLGTVASWARDLGVRGLAVMLDEVERTEALSSVDYSWALEFLRHLAAATLPDKDLAFRPASLYSGGHLRHRALGTRFEEDQPLVVVTAMTPLESTMVSFRTITKSSEHATELAPLGDGVVKGLVAGIATVYGAAYPGFDLEATALHAIADQVLDERAMNMSSFRRTVRAVVAHLDAARLRLRVYGA